MNMTDTVQALVNAGDIAQAVMKCREMMLSEEHKIDGAFLVGKLEMAFGNFGQGFIVAAQALNLAPDRGDIAAEVEAAGQRLFSLADNAVAAGDAAAAAALLRTKLAVSPDDRAALGGLAALIEPLAAQAGRDEGRRDALAAVLRDLEALTGASAAAAAGRHGATEAYIRAGARPSYTIGVTTFDKRFHTYFTPLMRQIRAFCPRADVVVCVNGNHKQDFDPAYRRDLLRLAAEQPNVYPVIFPVFRGLSRMWNAIAVNSPADYVLLLNDDVGIFDGSFFSRLEETVRRAGTSFKINNLWSHFVMNKAELDRLGYFEERLLGIGGEDGDMEWRYLKAFGRPMHNERIPVIFNFWSMEATDNIEKMSGKKYSLFNEKFLNSKFVPGDGGIVGLFDEPRVMAIEHLNPYPAEAFFLAHRHEL
jgi:hypothetical protein